MSRRSWVQDPETGKLIPKEEWHGRRISGPYVVRDIDPFISPIDGSVITSRPQLDKHNREHGVTNTADYSPEYMLSKTKDRVAEATGQTREAKRERIELIRRQLDGRT